MKTIFNWYSLLAFLFIMLWIVPVTTLGYFSEPLNSVFIDIKFPFLLICLLVIVISSKCTFEKRFFLFFFFASLSAVASNNFEFSSVKTCGLFLALLFFSPALRSRKLTQFRAYIWKNICWVFIFITLVSIPIYLGIFSVPQLYFKNGNAGVTSHAMLFGPIAGVSAIILFIHSLLKGKVTLFILSLLSIWMVYTSESRVALSATLLGIIFLIVLTWSRNKSNLFKGILIFITIATLYMSFGMFLEYLGMVDDSNLFETKGLEIDSREKLWNDRIYEFSSSPLLGLGIGMGSDFENGNIGQGSKFTGVVEPGSSYLAILSMTGLLGFISLMLPLLIDLFVFLKARNRLPESDFLEISCVGFFLLIHGVAEGWIYAPGGIICVLFWLWWGRLFDAPKLNNKH
jgi:O-antigen ligase